MKGENSSTDYLTVSSAESSVNAQPFPSKIVGLATISASYYPGYQTGPKWELKTSDLDVQMLKISDMNG